MKRILLILRARVATGTRVSVSNKSFLVWSNTCCTFVLNKSPALVEKSMLKIKQRCVIFIPLTNSYNR